MIQGELPESMLHVLPFAAAVLSSLRPAGQVMVVDFFAPWCKTCPAKAKEPGLGVNGLWNYLHVAVSAEPNNLGTL